MATCREVVADALRLARVVGIGREPKGAESEAGMRCLQSLYDGWVTGGMFGRLEDEYLDADGEAQEGKRYFIPSGIFLTGLGDSYTPEDEETRQPRDLAIYEVNETDSDRYVQLYDRDKWIELTNLDLDDEAPLSGRGAMGLAACVATSGAFLAFFGSGQGVSPYVERLAASFTQSLSFKRGTTRDRAANEYF